MTSNSFKSFFIIIGNEMQNLGYHFCQISQNVTPILKPIVSFFFVTYAFSTFFSPHMLYPKTVNILLCSLKNSYRFQKHFLHIKCFFLCIIASKNPIHKDLLTSPIKLYNCYQFHMHHHNLFQTY
jgi:hypothetical protein